MFKYVALAIVGYVNAASSNSTETALDCNGMQTCEKTLFDATGRAYKDAACFKIQVSQ